MNDLHVKKQIPNSPATGRVRHALRKAPLVPGILPGLLPVMLLAVNGVLPPSSQSPMASRLDRLDLLIITGMGIVICILVGLLRKKRGAVGAQEDDPAWREGQAALFESEERMRLFLAQAPVAIAMLDTQMRYIASSHRWVTDYGLENQLLRGRSHYEIFPEIPERWKEIHRRCLTGVVDRADEDPFERADGSIQWIRWEIRPWHLPSGAIGGIVIFSEDITERKNKEEMLRASAVIQAQNALLSEQNTELLAARRELDKNVAELAAANTELEAFSYTASHDLRAPLRQLLGHVEILKQSTGDALDADAIHQMQHIKRAASRMGRMIDEMIDFLNIGRTQLALQPVNIRSLLDQAIHVMKPVTENRRIEWLIKPLPCVTGDPDLLRTVWINLLDNALKFTRSRDVATIEVGFREDPTELIMFVRDNGTGIDMRYSEKLFGVFQRLHGHSNIDGTGIGLAKVRRIIHRHGGRTWADSVLGQGTTVYFALPVTSTNGVSPPERNT